MGASCYQPQHLVLSIYGQRQTWVCHLTAAVRLHPLIPPPVACDKATFQYMQKAAKAAARAPASYPASSPKQVDDDEIEILDDSSYTEDTQNHADDDSDAGAASESEGDTFKLILRSGGGVVKGDIMLTVRPTTTCGAIVRAYLKKAGIADQYPAVSAAPAKKGSQKRKNAGGKAPKLSIDGDTAEDADQIGEKDLEDGDLVEVVGL